MFTGLIQEVGTVVEWTSPVRLKISCYKTLDNVELGDSIAVNGVCLTVVDFNKTQSTCEFDVSQETQSRWNHKAVQSGRLINLEKSLRVGDKIGGHFVLGHVDCIARIHLFEKQGDFWLLKLDIPSQQLPYIIPKGSLAVDGISLTINDFSDNLVDLMIVPHTWEQTNLKERQVDDYVNIEADVLGKYVSRQLQFGSRNSETSDGVNMQTLMNAGFIKDAG